MDQQDSPNLNVKDISFINDIKSIAVVGPSKKRNYDFLRNHAADFKGNVYAVHPSVKEIPDYNQNKIFSSLKEITENIDYAWISVPPSEVLNVIDDCTEKGVKLITVFTSEFSDSGTEKGLKLEKELLNRAKNEVRILGPNGMGLFYPRLGIAWRSHFPTTAGNVGFIGQSGGMCNMAIYSSERLGIHFSKVFSFGNGADLDFVDLLYYLSNDPETELILCYLEGLKKGRICDLRRVLKQNFKPTLVLKGGRSRTGSIAAKTHTASISGDNSLWEGLFKQYNLIEVNSLEQLLNTARLIQSYGIFEVKNLAIFSISGGYGVVLTDLIEQYGMKVPSFSTKIQDQLNSKFFLPGTSPKNPLDLSAHFFVSNFVYETTELILLDENIDGLILDMPSYYLSPIFTRSRYTQSFEEYMIKSFSLGHKYNKPIIPIIQRLNQSEDRNRVVKRLTSKKVPVFGDPLEFIPLLQKVSNFKRKQEK
ncbi:MAG: CoA-binding protein [Candidatus Thorarchaeota archaeon]